MFYQEKIEYTGTPIRAIISDGLYCITNLADNVPVTHLVVGPFLAKFRTFSIYEQHGKINKIIVDFNGTLETKFIGEMVIIYDLLEEMLLNSIDAGAKTFRIDVHDDGEQLRLTVSDDGRGLGPEIASKVLKTDCTYKAIATGYTLLFAASNLEKIGGTVTYLGKGLDGVGASFSITFLKEMPTA